MKNLRNIRVFSTVIPMIMLALQLVAPAGGDCRRAHSRSFGSRVSREQLSTYVLSLADWPGRLAWPIGPNTK